MSLSARIVLPELLDVLAPDDPRACRARRDLRRVHRAMCSVSILKRAIAVLRLASPPQHVIELGAGDGSLMLRLAQALSPRWRHVSLTILDRHDLVSDQTRAAYQRLGWRLTVISEDALRWAAAADPHPVDLCIAVLFLHHFDSQTLPMLMSGIAANTKAFIACEPRRNFLGRFGSQCISLLGAGQVTREDAVKSVAAGFCGQELTALWPQVNATWMCKETGALPFSHCFAAARNDSVDR